MALMVVSPVFFYTRVKMRRESCMQGCWMNRKLHDQCCCPSTKKQAFYIWKPTIKERGHWNILFQLLSLRASSVMDVGGRDSDLGTFGTHLQLMMFQIETMTISYV